MIFLRALFLMLLTITASYASDHIVLLGKTKVIIQQSRHGKGPTYVHLHQNEITALHAAKVLVKERGGRILTLKHRGGRNIVFYLHKTRYEFDPNRIFTAFGIRKTLHENGAYSPAAAREVKKLTHAIKIRLPQGKIIAVHNNKSYSLKDYLPGKGLAHDAKQLHVTARQHYRNFFLVTRKSDYLRLKREHFNSVLQAKHAADDGSLSIYLAKRRYINVEAGYYQLRSQINMLKHA